MKFCFGEVLVVVCGLMVLLLFGSVGPVIEWFCGNKIHLCLSKKNINIKEKAFEFIYLRNWLV